MVESLVVERWSFERGVSAGKKSLALVETAVAVSLRSRFRYGRGFSMVG